MKVSFEGLQKKLPTLVAHWLNEETHGLVELKEGKTEIKLARFTGPSDAKITLFLSLTEIIKLGVPSIPSRLSLHLHYFDGRYTTTRIDSASKWTEEMISLMLAIDQAGCGASLNLPHFAQAGHIERQRRDKPLSTLRSQICHSSSNSATSRFGALSVSEGQGLPV